jgi:6-phospho-beta-glucosidase
VGVKIVGIGGASTYTPELVEGLATRSDRLPVDELALMDINAERLEVIGALAGRMLDRAGWHGLLTTSTEVDEAVDGAHFVIVQIRVGGQQARQSDETLPLRFGRVGQETVGAGGFAKALRTVPVVLDLAERVAVRGAPGAWLVDFTNPVGIVTQALLDHGHRAVGLCNVAIGLQRRYAELLGVEPERVELEHVGLNHLSWERAVRVDGRDFLPDLLKRHGKAVADSAALPLDLIELIGAVPSSYLRYYYATGEVLEHQRTHPSRAEEVMAIEAGLMDLYRDQSLAEKPKLLEQRGGAFYSEAAAQLMASLYAGTGDIQVVDVRNDGAISSLPHDAVVEVPARIDRDGAHPVTLGALPPELLGLVEHVKAYERLAVRASVSGDRGAALAALLTNPLVGEYSVAAPLLDALLEANRQYVPLFFD